MSGIVIGAIILGYVFLGNLCLTAAVKITREEEGEEPGISVPTYIIVVALWPILTIVALSLAIKHYRENKEGE